MNRLTQKQYDWINDFIELTGISVNQDNLDAFTDGKITWEEFMAQEIQDFSDHVNNVLDNAFHLWKEEE